MIIKLHILFLLSILITAKSACDSGYFTHTKECDTVATPLICRDFTFTKEIHQGTWSYYFIELDGTEDVIDLEFQVSGANPDAYVVLQSNKESPLPKKTFYDYVFHLTEGTIPASYKILINKINFIGGGKLVVGIYNDDNSDADVGIRYFAHEGNCQRSFNPVGLGLLLGISIPVVITFAMGLCELLKMKHLNERTLLRTAERAQATRENNLDTEAAVLQGDTRSPPVGIKTKKSNCLTIKEIEEFFPKKSFENLENPFQEEACSICLEDFVSDDKCHQLYCQHIFHEACIQKWLIKQNSCPSCRVLFTKKIIKEFLEAYKKKREKEKTNKAINISPHVEIDVKP